VPEEKVSSEFSNKRNPRKVDSILFSQKIKLDREKNMNEIQLGNVKNQMHLNHYSQHSKKNAYNMSDLSGAGGEFEKN
jgi:hypothetical protein